jgi:hypothetical protein
LEWFYGNAGVTDFEHGEVLGAAGDLEDYAVSG